MASETEKTKQRTKRHRLEWDFQVGKTNRSLQMWRSLALIMSAATVLLVLDVGSYLKKPKLVPYVVEVAGDEITFKGLMQPTPLSVTDAAVIHYLKRFIDDMVSVSTDAVVLKEQLRDTYAIATVQAQAQVSRYINQTDPFKAAASGEHVDVKFTGFTKQAERTWHVEWVEEVWQNGKLTSEPAMAGTFTYTMDLPTTSTEAEVNPFGLLIDEFFISRRSQQGGP